MVFVYTHTHTHTNTPITNELGQFSRNFHINIYPTKRLQQSNAYSAGGRNDIVCYKISGTHLQLSLPPLSYLITTQPPSSTTCNSTHYLHEFRATVLDNTVRYSTDLDNSIRKYGLSFGSDHAFQLAKSDVD